MGRIRILCVGYRSWALKIFHNLISIPDIDVSILSSKDGIERDRIDSISPDIIFFYGWSWMVPEDIINSYLCLCLHPSKLPKYRGGSPLQNQIINNEKESAVSIFRMTNKVDDGDICFQEDFSLSGNISDIFEKISEIGLKGTKSIIETVKKNMDVNFVKQDSKEATFFKRLKPNQSEITLEDLKNKPSFWLNNKIRMLTDPYPNAYIVCCDGKKLFLNDSYVEEKE